VQGEADDKTMTTQLQQDPMNRMHRSYATTAYRQIQVETVVNHANPHQLVSLLFDGLLAHIASARGAIERGDTAAKGNAIGMAVRITEEGLRAGLNLQAGGSLALQLSKLYDCVVARLTLANLHNDAKPLLECTGLLEPVRQAWLSIAQPRAQLPLPSRMIA